MAPGTTYRELVTGLRRLDRHSAGLLTRQRGQRALHFAPDHAHLTAAPAQHAQLPPQLYAIHPQLRVEVASVTLAARAWAALQPGDVVSLGRPLGDPVVLRVAGREIARGDLVDVDGELGVRIVRRGAA